jgi:hypothetical protein
VQPESRRRRDPLSTADKVGEVRPAPVPASRHCQFVDNELIEALLALRGCSAESGVHLGRNATDSVLNGSWLLPRAYTIAEYAGMNRTTV